MKNHNKIREILNRDGRKQAWLAEKLECPKGTVSNWCNNKNQPTFADLYRIALVLDIEPSDLLYTLEELKRL